MGSLAATCSPTTRAPASTFAVPLHGFDAAVEHALREWEAVEPLRAR